MAGFFQGKRAFAGEIAEMRNCMKEELIYCPILKTNINVTSIEEALAYIDACVLALARTLETLRVGPAWPCRNVSIRMFLFVAFRLSI